MASYVLLIYENGQQVRRDSSDTDLHLNTLEIGTTPLVLSEDSGHWDLDAKQVKNVQDATDPQDAATYNQVLSNGYKVMYHTLTASNEGTLEITLPAEPLQPERTLVDVFNGGGPLRYSIDFTVSGYTLTWAGGRFDGVLAEGDEVRIIYY
jgi:hypothetical protein